MSLPHTPDFRIEWNLHELGPRPQPALQPLTADSPSLRKAIALALAAGDLTAEAAEAREEEETA